jgi:uncharacterized repeat protein (TIGR03803 family)
MSKLNWVTKACSGLLLWAMAAIALPAQTLTVLHSFDGTDGEEPSRLVQGTDGNFYGVTTEGGGANKGCSNDFEDTCGTVFTITPNGMLTTLYNFCSLSNCADGYQPGAPLVQGTDGIFYGTTNVGGGAKSDGTVFKITPSGILTTLYTFCSQSNCADGAYPGMAGLIQGADGDFYGTTAAGGIIIEQGYEGFGTIFKITSSGKFTTLHRFDGTDGEGPNMALVQASNLEFYGTTYSGGSGACGSGCGTVFSITPSGVLTRLHSFHVSDGQGPGPLVQSTDGSFYGTTGGGGAYSGGTVFKLTPGFPLVTLHDFVPSTEGSCPNSLFQGTDGHFYGTAYFGGTGDDGTLFSVTPSGTLTTLYNFTFGGPDGGNPRSVVQLTDGTFYGSTYFGGTVGDNCPNGCGVLFSLPVGLEPFVETQPIFGAVGAAVNILGSNLTGATNVTFNGTRAAFTVVSHSLITTTVPAGATTGTVEVVRPNGKGLSNVPFTVLP